MEYLRVCVRWLILCVLVTPISVIADECDAERCKTDHNPEGKPCGPTKYRDCLEAIAKQCHENLHYRLLVAGLKNCTSADDAAAVTPTSLPQPPEATCQWLLADGGYGQCGLYGDPHLQTFGGKLQTCRAVGAWPMVDNAYLAVQVTNSHAGATATVVSKVTVVVHSHGSCALEKTYEAQLRDLPSVFKDGTTSAGRGVELTTPELDLVELTLYHAGVRLRIRQHGDFLSVTLRMPTQIADMGTPLCSQGCPTRELLPELHNVEQWRRENAESSCTK
ncbi:secreted protein, putative [Ixodes scapularis]|uniref:Secreted protein, putative n=2 Tax=Ixodes scapularis TaxID=6945 RepID=B7P4U0_IXOSC|nr:secreted protein, putative [Ixodes scapularis]|eukprot:XP_002406441.1 secreted protein, putative [Ixodes scapularis]